MSISIPGKVVVFDYGEVISYSPNEEDRAALLRISELPEGDFWPTYWANRHALDEGTLSIPDYWRAIAAAAGVEFSETRIQQLWVADYRSWLSVNPGTYDILSELHHGGTRLALLSNAGFDFAGYFRRGPMGELFERVFVSAEMATLKPRPDIYLTVLAELGLSADEMIFVDNRPENIEGAELIGITGHVFTDVDELREFLVEQADEAAVA